MLIVISDGKEGKKGLKILKLPKNSKFEIFGNLSVFEISYSINFKLVYIEIPELKKY